jgi:hypothetical protein
MSLNWPFRELRPAGDDSVNPVFAVHADTNDAYA